MRESFVAGRIVFRRLFQRLRNAIVGLNAVQARFDLVQNRLDALLASNTRADERLARMEESVSDAGVRLSKNVQSALDEIRARDDIAQNRLDTVLVASERVTERLVHMEAASSEALKHLSDNLMSGPDGMQTRFDSFQSSLDAALATFECANSKLNRLEDAARTVTYRRSHMPGRAELSTVGSSDCMPALGGLRLAFLLQSLELCNHFGPVWSLLPPDSFTVLLHGPDETEARTMLQRWGCAVRSSQEVLDCGDVYAFLVSNHPLDTSGTPLINRLAVHNVRFMYAAGKSGWNLSAWNALYDVILSFGPHHTQALSTVTDATIVQMGYPRFDRYFTEEVSRADLMLRYGCDPSRQTVVWLPTWKDLSSVGWFDQEVSALSARYNVVVKLHPLMAEQETERVASISKHAFNCLITDSSDNLPLYQLADYMLFDYGGPPMAALYADKNMLLLDVPGAQTDPLLGEDSPDIQIRQILGSLSHGEGCIAGMLSDTNYWQKQAPQRKQLRQPYFAPYYGFSAQVAASALMRLECLVANSS